MPENPNPTSPADFAAALDRLAALTRSFTETVQWADGGDQLTRPVLTCPGWSVSDLVDHLAGIHRWAAAALGAEHAPAPVPRPQSEPLVAWYRSSAAHLLDGLRAAGPAAPAWTLWGDRVAAFWARRQIHETAVHTFDLLGALGRAEEWRVPEDEALDGIREVLFGFYPRQVRLGRSSGLPGVVRFEVTHDGGAPSTGLVSPSVGDGPEAAAQLGTVRGPAAAIYLGLWKRRALPGAHSPVTDMIRAARLTP
ncbi:maleylpyruvate isomerase family mycothiol-dependent enzyme [Sinomonas notoginsengisoli]|uniref:maleylpyruvate isomerase family mycothiol-dependent enzyme n=1 Tax=Sinomonas notoginsengisoli TaxID=1457311 RepID=UPI001F36CAD7|nr:maleylpyruvate isomerase family mycothiol-dependent enzyme [Sinomonas notoginsengisoli]